MKFKLLNEYYVQKEYAGKADKEHWEEFSKIYENILQEEFKGLNDFLNKYGFKAVLLDYDEDREEELRENNWVAMFCLSEQNDIYEFPMYISKDVVYEYVTNECPLNFDGNISTQEVRDVIVGNIYHETGHGIMDFLKYDSGFDWDFGNEEDEEEAAEEFAECTEDSEIMKSLQEYMDDIESEEM